MSTVARVRPDMVEAARNHAALPLTFNDDGTGGDLVRGDLTYTTTLQPAKQGFGSYHGPLWIQLEIRVKDEQGITGMEVDYTPQSPAAFTGTIREAVEDGSLSLHVGMKVAKPGRYVISARVDDADGKSFAYLRYIEEVAAGDQEIKLVVFGKLIRDLAPPSPFHLRDVEGFLLLEDAYPDRALMTSLLGTVHKTKSYQLTAFSDAEFHSEERERHLTEFTRRLEEAKRALSNERGP